jgi:hypothetical protein
MKHKRFIPVLVLTGTLLFLSVPSEALKSKGVDFSGKWVLNEEKSTLGESRNFSATELSVSQDGNILNIDRTRTGRDGELRTTSEKVVADGSRNVSERENGSTASVASWSDDGNTLNIAYDIVFNRQGETFTMKRNEVWTLDAGGKVLTIQSNSSSPRGETSMTMVYDKE